MGHVSHLVLVLLPLARGPHALPNGLILVSMEWKYVCPWITCCFFGRGPPRRPPPHVLEQVKSLNQSLRLGHLLCRSRHPDFLLNIIQRQVGSLDGLAVLGSSPSSLILQQSEGQKEVK